MAGLLSVICFDPCPCNNALVVSHPQLVFRLAAVDVRVKEHGTERQRQVLSMPVWRQLDRDLSDQLLRLVIHSDDEGLHALTIVMKMRHQTGASRLNENSYPGNRSLVTFPLLIQLLTAWMPASSTCRRGDMRACPVWTVRW